MEDVLEMAYHPAKKEVRFKRFQDGREVKIEERSGLTPYMENRGKFVLQHYGEKFFDDIAFALDGQREITMRVITTKPDFDDFQQMVEYYNSTNKDDVKILPTPGEALSDTDGFLPDMNQVYENVRDYGRKAIDVLDELRSTFSSIPQDKEAIRESIANFDGDIQREIERIKEKRTSLTDNNVNLCFAGAYSTGKSALINALLGYRILPESSDSKTARMFQIKSPKSPDDTVSIAFEIASHKTSLKWTGNRFSLEHPPTENTTSKKIRTQLREFENSDQQIAQHDQLCKLLELLNKDDDVGTNIEITFPIPLDTETVQFTIFDTPGTDSNYEVHQETLIEALSEQTNSILIFVASPDKMEGAGNRMLLSFINQARKSGTATIDISRSLFVINKADTVGPDDRVNKHNAQITSEKGASQSGEDECDEISDIAGEQPDDSIALSDKKLLFVSAKVAYSAKAEKNEISTSKDSDTFDTAVYQQTNKKRERAEMHRYYKQNRCANSSYATDQMITRCDAAMVRAQEGNDEVAMVLISSGLYALEQEIIQYGEKYAAAVRAYAMIAGVNTALNTLQKEANNLKIENEENLRKINQEIGQIKNVITQSIKKAIGLHTLPHGVVPNEQVEFLALDDKTYWGIEKRVVKAIKKRLNQLFPRSDEKKKQHMKTDIDSILNEWMNSYLNGRDALLTRERDSAIKDARDAIEANGKVYPSAVQYVCNVQPPKIEPRNVSIARLYDSSQSERDFLWMHTKSLDKNKFITAVKEELKSYRTVQAKAYRRDYVDSFENILQAVQEEFEKNLEKYSVLVRAKLENRQSVEALHKQVVEAANKLEELQRNLERIIWKVQADD